MVKPKPSRKEAGVWRALDANANRAREGLRIVEDTARFVLNKPDAARAFRTMRHALDELVRKHYKTLLQHRNVEHDSGRKNMAQPYKGIGELLAANFKRCEEALRVLEEYGRLLSPGAVTKAQALRFEVYRMEKQLTMDVVAKPRRDRGNRSRHVKRSALATLRSPHRLRGTPTSGASQ